MKIRKSSRVTALVLALVMMLPLISIPAFAEETATPSANWSEDFKGSTAQIGDVTNGRPNTAKLENGELTMSLAPNADAEYYLWYNWNNKVPLKDVVENADGTISGTTASASAEVAAGITVTNSTVNTTSCISVATTSDTSKTYYVVTGDYADAIGGFCGNIATPLKFKNTAFVATDKKVLIEWNLTFSSDAVATKIQGRIGTTGGNLELFWMSVADGVITVRQHENATISAGATKMVNSNNVHIAYEVDLATGFSIVYINNAVAWGQYNNNSLSNIGLNANSLNIEISRGDALNNAGTVSIDRLAISVGGYADKYTVIPTDKTFYSEDFESYIVGTEPENSFNSIGVSGSTVQTKENTKAWYVEYVSGGTNINVNPKIKNPEISYIAYDSIVYEVSYYFDDNAKGQLQSQLFGKAVIGTAKVFSDISWCDIYQINLNTVKPTLKFEGGANQSSSTTTMERNQWNTISAVINLKTGKYDIYINRKLAISDVQLYRSGALTNITISANNIILGKPNNGTYMGTGSYYMDNIKVFTGTEPTGGVDRSINWSENFDAMTVGNAPTGVSVPTSAKIVADGKTGNAVKITMGSDQSTEDNSMGYNFVGYENRGWNIDTATEDEENHVFYACGTADNDRAIRFTKNGDGTVTVTGYYIKTGATITNTNTLEAFEALTFTDRTDTLKIYNTLAAADCFAINPKNVDKAFKLENIVIADKTITKVVLSASYYFSADSKGAMESQFHYNGFQNLYRFDATAGTVMGVAFPKAEWFTMQVVMNPFSTEKGDVYMNGVYIGQTDAMLGDGIQAGEWSVAKVVKGEPDSFAGYFMVDEVSISNMVEEETNGFLGNAFDTFKSGLVSTLGVTSVRLKTPTGLRFATDVDDAKIQLLANLKANGKIKDYKMGTIIAPADYVSAAGGSMTKASLDTLGNTVNYLDIAFGGEYYQTKIGNYEHVMTASIVNIQSHNIDRNFSACGYVEIELNDGTILSVYSDAVVTANVKAAAQTALNMEGANWTTSELEILRDFAGTSAQ